MNIIIESEHFCLHDAKDPNHAMVLATRVINQALHAVPQAKVVSISYINVTNHDPESRNYNPDGMIGHFSIVAALPSCH